MPYLSKLRLLQLKKEYINRQKIKNRITLLNYLRKKRINQINNQLKITNSLHPDVKQWHKHFTPDNIFWLHITSGFNHNYIFALSIQGIYKSNTSGSEWTICLLANNITWYNICCNVTGQYVVASSKKSVIENSTVKRQNIIYQSEDYGETWNTITFELNPNENDYLIKIKYTDRQSFISLSLNGYIYESIDYGKNWVQISTINIWCSSIVCNYNNNLLIVASGYNKGGIYVSKNYGISWTKQMDVICNLITASTCCQYLACTSNSTINGGIYVSNDYGINWNRTLSLSCIWTSITMDCTGMIIYASSCNDGIYFSDNYGISWIKFETTINDWNCLMINEDGNRLVASTLNHSSKVSDIYVYA